MTHKFWDLVILEVIILIYIYFLLLLNSIIYLNLPLEYFQVMFYLNCRIDNLIYKENSNKYLLIVIIIIKFQIWANKCLLIITIMIKFHIYTKIKEIKTIIVVNYFYALHELPTSNIYKTGDIWFIWWDRMQYK